MLCIPYVRMKSWWYAYLIIITLLLQITVFVKPFTINRYLHTTTA